MSQCEHGCEFADCMTCSPYTADWPRIKPLDPLTFDQKALLFAGATGIGNGFMIQRMTREEFERLYGCVPSQFNQKEKP